MVTIDVQEMADAISHYFEHTEEGRETLRKGNEEQEQQKRSRNKRWNENNKERRAAHTHNRRVRKQNQEGAITPNDIQEQVKNQTNRKGVHICWWCEKPLNDDMSIDHRIPLSRGGKNEAGNIVIVHLRCNQCKGSKMPSEWIGRLL